MYKDRRASLVGAEQEMGQLGAFGAVVGVWYGGGKNEDRDVIQ